MTTFDEVYEYFNDISQGIDNYYLPNNIDGQKRLISNGRRLFNNKLFKNVQQDNLTEIFDKVLSENEIMLMAHCMRLYCLNRMYDDFISIYSMFQKEVGFKDYKAQCDGRLSNIQFETKNIDDLVFSMLNDIDGEV